MPVRVGSPDVLYMVKQSEDNEELRYSLRSLKNLNHGNIFIVGYKPSWTDDSIIHIPVKQSGDKPNDIRGNLIAALKDSRLSDNFILMHDNFFIMKPTKYVPVLRRLRSLDYYIGLLNEVDSSSCDLNDMKLARDVLRDWGVRDEISSYELHVPMVFNKKNLMALIDRLPEEQSLSHMRTIYGNYYSIGGERMKDVREAEDSQATEHKDASLSSIDELFESGSIEGYVKKRLAKVLVFSHANDPDGLLCVILAQLAFPEVDYLLTNNPQTDITAYLDGCSNLDEYDYVFITDIYPGKPVLQRLKDAYWFESKQHNLDKIREHNLQMPNATIRIDTDGRPNSASSLFYEWLSSNDLISDDVASFVEVIRRQDNWDYS